MSTELNVADLRLGRGVHKPGTGACVLELSSYLARENWSDSPECVSLVIAAFLRDWHDALSDEVRQLLKPYAWEVLGTATTAGDEVTRKWMAVDWLVRVQAPAWLRLAGLTDDARALESLPRIVDATTATTARPAISAARDAAWAAAWAAAATQAPDAAAPDAALAAEWAVAWAAQDAAWAVAWAAQDAAWAAAAGAAMDAAKAAARAVVVAAVDAAKAAARAAARAAAWQAQDPACALAPTVLETQASAFALLDEMIAVGRLEVEPLVPPNVFPARPQGPVDSNVSTNAVTPCPE
jgi:hypothetical protein